MIILDSPRQRPLRAVCAVYLTGVIQPCASMVAAQTPQLCMGCAVRITAAVMNNLACKSAGDEGIWGNVGGCQHGFSGGAGRQPRAERGHGCVSAAMRRQEGQGVIGVLLCSALAQELGPCSSL